MKRCTIVLGIVMILIGLWALPAPVAGADDVMFAVYASSHLDSTSKYTYYPENAFDGDMDTCWSEGAKGSGIGESIWVNVDRNVLVESFQIWNGYQKSKETYYNNNRVKQLGIYADGERITSCVLSDSYSADDENMQSFTLSEYVVASRIEFVIEDVYKGSKYNDTCIAEIAIFIE